MKKYLDWLLFLLIYLSVNGQVFSTPVHICQAMAANNQSLLSSATAVEIHEHPPMVSVSAPAPTHSTMHHANSTVEVNSSMESCHCVDCDCTNNMLGQANGYLLYSPITIVAVKNDSLLVEGEKNFISQPHPNLFRPPIFI